MATGKVLETGLSVIYDPPNEAPIAEYSLFVVIRFTNWNGTEGVFWPQDLLRHDCDRARILTWGYDSHVTKGYESANKNNVFAHAKNLLANLKRDRPEGRPIIFVAHSLGGILVKEVLRRSNESTQDIVVDIVRSTSAVVFLGTPHRGSSKAADIGQAFRQAASTLLRVDSNAAILRALGADSPELELGRESFIVLWRKYKFSVKTFQESKPMAGVNVSILNELVVSKESSSLDDPEENAETIEADHRMMCKFYGAEDPSYIQVSGELKGFVNSILRKYQSRRREAEVDMLGHAGNCYAAPESSYSSIGILLVYIPQLIKAVEYYGDGVSTIDSMKVYENVFIDSQMLLMTSLDMFEKCCRRLVRNLPDTQVHRLIDFHKGWSDPQLQAQLHQQLGEDSAKFIVTIKQTKKRIELLQRKLKLRADFEESFNTWSRVGSEFNLHKYTEVIDQIHQGVQRICTFMPEEVDPIVIQGHQSFPRDLNYWLDIQTHTYRLFNAISSIWPRDCAYHTHHAKLRLNIPTEDREEQEAPKVNVSFAMDKRVSLTQHYPRGWRDVKVIFSQAPRVNIFKKEVRFSPTSITIDPLQAPNKCASERKIENICTMLEENHQIKCLGLLHSEGWHYHIHDPTNYARNLTPLGDILSSHNITTRQRRTLALTLASGVLQLYDTPWLRDNWTLYDIYIDSSQGVDYLYVLRMFDECSLQQHLPGRRPSALDCVRNRTLFALGVALLELTYGAPLSAQKTEEDLNDALTPHRIVWRLTKKIEHDELPQFARAVFKCIHPDAEGFEFSLANQGFRRRFFQEVVLPLKNDYDELPRIRC
ncbi:hypothetical protein UA08_09132 [Talaromyces atroroseus]|uniref:DUF7580 domain-containing protein n=1 Tax=Talaromyces atroroseus TaxID=1441469 RepID=A0A1Q5Q6X0_TALAT|nr:hypothetical protein UA08_09132 [Talaromyces atroroseus]OKL55592.1 hypothetical protein UA08_09132 [Talaromyces atroroseus]